ncbi:MAG: ATP phosphoribosyltransferase regulatory subunit [Sulfuricurvum sp. PC08-66]|nr:MAG: ATP phosphoribosyltransferase regulatory subunit [Sulfuricurvum sp. PC08-66]
MVLEHEIPTGSKLYFGSMAKLKRHVESVASTVLMESGFEEIVTPLFSYHQHLSIEDAKEVIRVHDERNNPMTLRADSTIDVVRLIDKRLGRNTAHKKWFYIQPVFRFPATERYQVGAEYIGEKGLDKVLGVAVKIFDALACKPLLQLSNINIPTILVRDFGYDIELFRRIEVAKLLEKGDAWMADLVYLNDPKAIDATLLAKVPKIIATELEKLKNLALSTHYAPIVVAPLFYAQMRYYDELFFRFIHNNDVLSLGGRYEDSGVSSVGFALSTDELIDTLDQKQREG